MDKLFVIIKFFLEIESACFKSLSDIKDDYLTLAKRQKSGQSCKLMKFAVCNYAIL